ncbi:hypothetical protein KSP35_20840 [Aquihabitans sp. G128]|uniref:hypothetical protein n=1 Tax=Aquihabitans sp. G128 TaxID=2849779 RepID=UPI001C2414BC|nr:hypothetical protein [Aquihabitans sp. G128]QXC60740.1 hypothetical protein KSP35_20840 [Aquihabitans sp. G128]
MAVRHPVDEVLQGELLDLLRAVQASTPVITTIADGRPNWIVGVDERGVRVETEASREKGTGDQLVAAWMLQVAWDHLRTHGSLQNRYLVATSGLSVKRSSAVCALLARLPGVTVASTRPIELRYQSIA